jgi:hypothetical protein
MAGTRRGAGETSASRTIAAGGTPGWTFLTNHAHVLICLSQDPELRLRDVASRVGITERAVQRIVSELEEAGYLTRDRTGRRNVYDLHLDRPLRHPIESHRSAASLVGLIERAPRAAKAASRGTRPKPRR